jgi:hypothetical protein
VSFALTSVQVGCDFDGRLVFPAMSDSIHPNSTRNRRGRRSAPSLQRLAIVPRHPLRGLGRQFLSVALHLGQVVEGVGAAQLTSVNQAHEQVC